jgi:hypothetical protein
LSTTNKRLYRSKKQFITPHWKNQVFFLPFSTDNSDYRRQYSGIIVSADVLKRQPYFFTMHKMPRNTLMNQKLPGKFRQFLLKQI